MTRDHSVQLATPAQLDSRGTIRYPLVSLAGDPAALRQSLNDLGNNFLIMIHSIIKHAIEIEADILLRMEDACSDADLIIPVFMHAIDGHTLACEKNIPEIHILLFPIFTPTGAYPDMVLPD